MAAILGCYVVCLCVSVTGECEMEVAAAFVLVPISKDSETLYWEKGRILVNRAKKLIDHCGNRQSD